MSSARGYPWNEEMKKCKDCVFFLDDRSYGYSMGKCHKNVSSTYRIGYVFENFGCINFYPRAGEGE